MTDLFSYASQKDKYPYQPGFKKYGTSSEAAKRIRPCAQSLKDMAYTCIKGAPEGLTADEVAKHLSRSILSIRPRIVELKRLGMIEWCGTCRPNDSGVMAEVVVALAKDIILTYEQAKTEAVK